MKAIRALALFAVVFGAAPFVFALPGDNNGGSQGHNDNDDNNGSNGGNGGNGSNGSQPTLPGPTPPIIQMPPEVAPGATVPGRGRAVRPPVVPPPTPPVPTPTPDPVVIPVPTTGQKSPRNVKPPIPDPYLGPPQPAGGDDSTGGPATPPQPGPAPGAATPPAAGGARHRGWGGLGVGSNGGQSAPQNQPSGPSAAEAAAALQAADVRDLSKSVGAIDNSSADERGTLKAAGLIHAAKSKLDMGDPEGAARDATAALALAPNSARALTLRSSANSLLGHYEDGRRDALAALKFNPGDSAAAEDLAWSQLHLRDYQGAVETANLALKANPKSAQALATRAKAEQMLGRYAEMRADIAAAAKLDSRFAALAALAAAGKMIYDADASDSSYLLGAAAAGAPGDKGWPLIWVLGALAFAALASLGGLAAFTYFRTSRRRAAGPRLTPLRAAPKDEQGLLAGKYRLEGIIGRGGMGEVRRAKDMSLQRPVAVKTLISDLSGAGEEWKQKLRAEAMTVAGVHHPNIVDIYEIVEEDGVLHLVFEYVEGQTVHGVLAARGRLNAADCARILVPVCAALELAHSRGLVHRDLKPANVMITSTGHVKLMDFGIARPVGQRVKKEDGKPGASGLLFDRTTTVVGTPVYMAPEAERGMVGPACDVFSLGACLYEMLTGARPFRADATAYDKMEMIPPRPSALAPGVPEAVDKLVSAALSPDPSARPSVTQFARLLVEGARDVKDGGLTPPVSPVAK